VLCGCWRQSRLCRGVEGAVPCAVQKKRAVTKKPPSSSAVSLLVLKIARFLFICPCPRSPVESRLRSNNRQSLRITTAQGGLELEQSDLLPPPWCCVLLPASPRRPRGRRAGPGMGLGYCQGARPPPSGPFRGQGHGPWRGKSPLFVGRCRITLVPLGRSGSDRRAFYRVTDADLANLAN
jgi:hypothetical protein